MDVAAWPFKMTLKAPSIVCAGPPFEEYVFIIFND
jgi:hypothetical protein